MGLDLGRRSIVALGLLLLLAAPLAAQEDVADLIADLQSKDEYVRKLARDALVSKGESALEPVLGLLEHEDARLRTQALLILEGMGPKASRAVPRLRKIAAEDPNRDVRKLALSALLRIEPQMPVPMSDLIRMLKSSEDHQIEIAAETIMTLGPQARKAQPILIKLLQERQGAAVAAVRRKATPEEVARAVRAPEAQLRVPLARALGATAVASESGQTALLDHAMLQGHLFGLLPPEDLESLAASGARVLVVLVQRWSDYVRGRDAWVHEIAARIGVKAEDPILHVLREGNALEKTRAIDLLKAMGPSGGVSVATLIGALDDPAAAVRRGSAGALGSMGQAASAAVPALVELLRDKEMRSRLWAALALGQILGIGQRALSPRDQRKLIAQEGIGGGLEWLAAHQDVDGNGMWDCDAFMKHDPAGDKCDGPGRALYDPGVTGLALLAFLGAGCTDRDTPYANNVHMGLRYLSSIQDVEGCFGPRNNQHFVYNHAIATLAMCEAWAMTRNPRYKKPAQDGLNWISRARNPGLA
ncbi:MAG: HEAT repeat domain-containing protein, partial [Planctomycetota bacterium]|nr:HEAT repeat domain-containing protein [Planctomycetota bacterium]